MDTVTSIVNAISTYGPVVVEWAGVIVGAAAVAAAGLPKAKDTSSAIWIVARAVIDAIAMNIGNAKNQK